MYAWGSGIAMDPHPFDDAGDRTIGLCQREWASADGDQTAMCQWGRDAPIHSRSSSALEFSYAKPLAPGHHYFDGDLLGACQFIVETEPDGDLVRRFFCHRPVGDLVHVAALARWHEERQAAQPLTDIGVAYERAREFNGIKLPEGWSAEQLERQARYADPAAYAAHADLDDQSMAAQMRYHRMLQFIRARTHIDQTQAMAVLDAAHEFYASDEKDRKPLMVVPARADADSAPRTVSIQQRPSGHGVHVAQCKGFVPTTGFGNQKTCASCGAVQTAHQVRVQ